VNSASFFDTNVLLYLLSADSRKADIAERLVSLGGTISVQVLNEFTQVARRKFDLPAADVISILSALRRSLNVEPLTVSTHDLGIELSTRYSLSVYDSMIVASALQSGATRLYSEDLQAKLLVEKKLRIHNPFAPEFRFP
jgi:predicted nucleic acid-binding protein